MDRDSDGPVQEEAETEAEDSAPEVTVCVPNAEQKYLIPEESNALR